MPTPLPLRSPESFIARQVAELPAVGSRALALEVERRRAAHNGRSLLPLLAYPQRILPAHLMEAAAAAAAAPEDTPSVGLPALREAIASKIAREGGIAVDTANVLVTNGAMQALDVVMRTLLDPQDEVLLPAPCYFFDGIVRLAGGRAVLVPMQEADQYRWDLERIAAAITARTKLLVVSYPVNPTGYMPDASVLQALLELAEQHQLLIVSDESYDRLVYEGASFRSIAWLPGAQQRTIIVQSMTKSYALSPWRVGYIVAPAALIQGFSKVLEWEALHVNHICQAVAAAAIAGPQDWLAGVAAEFQCTRDLLLPAVWGTGIWRCPKPAGGPFLFLSAPQPGLTSDQLSRQLLWDWGIPTTAGSYFHMPHHVRLAFGAPEAVAVELAERLGSAAGALGHRGMARRQSPDVVDIAT